MAEDKADGMLDCPGCGYDVRGLTSGRCPECGATVDERALVRARERAWWRRTVPPTSPTWAAGWVTVVGIMAVGAWICGDSGAFGAMGGVLCAVAVGGSAGAGWIAAMAAPAHHRDLLRFMWFRGLWFLHAPWLCMPLCGFAVFIVATVTRSEGAVFATAVLGLGIWVPACIIAFAAWTSRWWRAADRLGLDGPSAGGLIVLAAAVIMLGAAALGFGGGVLATGGAMRLSGMADVFGP